ncbi:MAG: hypothetical protein R3F30_09155 [Planctomycetota bacterium]
MTNYLLSLNEDEALVLFEFFARFDETDKLQFEHAAEYLALLKVSAQIDRTTPAMFSPEYGSLLAGARERVAAGYEGEVPGMGSGGDPR